MIPFFWAYKQVAPRYFFRQNKLSQTSLSGTRLSYKRKVICYLFLFLRGLLFLEEQNRRRFCLGQVKLRTDTPWWPQYIKCFTMRGSQIGSSVSTEISAEPEKEASWLTYHQKIYFSGNIIFAKISNCSTWENSRGTHDKCVAGFSMELETPEIKQNKNYSEKKVRGKQKIRKNATTHFPAGTPHTESPCHHFTQTHSDIKRKPG